MITNNMLKNLFVLEMTNNHQGDLKRGIKIINEFSKIVKSFNLNVAIKLQFRDLSSFIHQDYKKQKKIKYIKRISENYLTNDEYKVLIEEIRSSGCIPLATAFDEKSVDLIEEFNLPIIKVASVDSNDWTLLQKISETKKPVIASLGGLQLTEIDNLVSFFQGKNIPLAINHCISAYPTKDSNLQLNQIDLLINRYPNNIIGLSSHEYHDWSSSIQIAYAKGARLFERHIDINSDNFRISQYSSLPFQIEKWFTAYEKAVEMCGDSSRTRIPSLKSEIEYLDSYARGVFAKRDILKGEKISEEDIYLAILRVSGQFSTRDHLDQNLFNKKTSRIIFEHKPIMYDSV